MSSKEELNRYSLFSQMYFISVYTDTFSPTYLNPTPLKPYKNGSHVIFKNWESKNSHTSL